MAEMSRVIQNRDATYMIPASGLYLPSVLDLSMNPPELIGPIWFCPGTSLIYDPQTVNEVSTGVTE